MKVAEHLLSEIEDADKDFGREKFPDDGGILHVTSVARSSKEMEEAGEYGLCSKNAKEQNQGDPRVLQQMVPILLRDWI